MDTLYLLAQEAAKSSNLFDMEFVKWMAGFLGAGYVPLLIYLKKLLNDRQDYLKEQVKEAKQERKDAEEERDGVLDKFREIENDVRARYKPVLEQKDNELKEKSEEIKRLQTEILSLRVEQMADCKDQEAALAKITEDYKQAMDQSVVPTLLVIADRLGKTNDLINWFRSVYKKQHQRDRDGS